MAKGYADIIKPGLTVGVIDADLLDNGTRHPNLALMKIARYCLNHGCKVELLTSYNSIADYDEVFVSKVFTFTKVPVDLNAYEHVHIGGTGFFENGGEDLPYEIEHSMPYYNLYLDYVNEKIRQGRSRAWFADYLDYSIGFLTRGCFRKCSFCVNKKYSRAIKHSPVHEFVDASRPYIYLWDDNFFACKGWEQSLDELEATGKPFQFRQGLDIRLLDEKKAARFARARYCGDFIFAFDHVEEKEVIERQVALWRRHTTRGTRLYVLCAYDSQDERDIEGVFVRIKLLMRYGCLPYIMRYESYKQSRWRALYVTIARWCNQPQFFKKKSFRDFCEANQNYHMNKSTLCSALQSLRDFEKEFPAIAADYFDLRYEDENMLYRYGRPFLGKPSDEVNEMQSAAWDRLAAGEKAREALADYYAKRLDIVWLEEYSGKDVVRLSGRLFDVIREATVEEAFAATVERADEEFVTAENIPQFSSIEDVLRVPEILVGTEQFLKFDDLGIMLTGGERKDARADKKYGENHGKLASLLDLASIEKAEGRNGFAMTLFSEPFLKLNDEEKLAFTAKLAFRIPIIQTVMKAATNGPVCISDYMEVLAETTKTRRLPNVVRIFDLIRSQAEGGGLGAALNNVGR